MVPQSRPRLRGDGTRTWSWRTKFSNGRSARSFPVSVMAWDAGLSHPHSSRQPQSIERTSIRGRQVHKGQKARALRSERSATILARGVPNGSHRPHHVSARKRAIPDLLSNPRALSTMRLKFPQPILSTSCCVPKCDRRRHCHLARQLTTAFIRILPESKLLAAC